MADFQINAFQTAEARAAAGVAGLGARDECGGRLRGLGVDAERVRGALTRARCGGRRGRRCGVGVGDGGGWGRARGRGVKTR